MKSLLMIHKIKIENANAIAGFTYGFPAITNFLGFGHALSRRMTKDFQIPSLGGCAVICHNHQVNAHRPRGWGDYVFSLTRNPLTKEASTPAFVEEGRMNLEISLFFECDFNSDDFDFDTGTPKGDIKNFENYIYNKALSMRLAGGTILNIKSVEFVESPNESEIRKYMSRLIPGFILVDRSDLLQKHHHNRLVNHSNAELVDTWLDFSALKRQASPIKYETEDVDEDIKAVWETIEKPFNGWLVPIMPGFKAISPLYSKGEVARTRDSDTPFRFVEGVHSIGQWISPHRIQNLQQIFWHYSHNDIWYLCKNRYQHYSNEAIN